MIDTFKRARRTGVPIVVIHTADQLATIQTIAAQDQLKMPGGGDAPMIRWDAAMGLRAVNEPGKQVMKSIKTDETGGFVEALTAAANFPHGTILFALNAHRQLLTSEPKATAADVQAVHNLRDILKHHFRMLVLLCPGMQVPIELGQDVVVIHDPLPDRERLAKIIHDVHKAGGRKTPATDVSKEVEAVSGLSSFAAEQQSAMALEKDADGNVHINNDMLWEHKRVAIEQTPGLRVHRGTEKFDDVVGLDSVKARLRQRLKGKTPVGCVVWLDEIDKVFANVEHDTSGVRMDQLRTLLTEMENLEWGGVILAGMPGGGKSLLGKAFGNEAGVPTIALDLAAMEGSLVGESEQRLRHAMSVIKAVGGGRAYFIATSNNATIMRPELQRRFTGGFFFFDLMTREERSAAWSFYLKKYGVTDNVIPNDEGWSAAEIRNCVREAWDSSVTLKEAAKFIVPVAQARADEFNEMRKHAHGRFLDASQPGPYKYKKETMEQHIRAVNLDLEGLAVAAATSGMKES